MRKVRRNKVLDFIRELGFDPLTVTGAVIEPFRVTVTEFVYNAEGFKVMVDNKPVTKETEVLVEGTAGRRISDSPQA